MLARPRGRAGHVEDVVEELEGQADAAAEGAEGAGVAAGLERAEAARRLEQARRLELAAREVALDRHRGVPGVGALAQLALGERAARVGEDADLVDPAVLRRARRTRGRTGGHRSRSRRRGPRWRRRSARPGAARRRRARRRGRAWRCGRARRRSPRGRAPRRPPRRPRGTRAAAAGACRRRRSSRRRARRASRRGRPRAAARRSSTRASSAGHVVAGGADDLGDGPADRHAQAFVPTWMAMIPPAVRIQRMSRRPGARHRGGQALGRREAPHRARAGSCRRRSRR